MSRDLGNGTVVVLVVSKTRKEKKCLFNNHASGGTDFFTSFASPQITVASIRAVHYAIPAGRILRLRRGTAGRDLRLLIQRRVPASSSFIYRGGPGARQPGISCDAQCPTESFRQPRRLSPKFTREVWVKSKLGGKSSPTGFVSRVKEINAQRGFSPWNEISITAVQLEKLLGEIQLRYYRPRWRLR